MNLLLLSPSEIDSSSTATIRGRRASHLKKVLQASPSDTFRAGILGGKVGQAHIQNVGSDSISLKFESEGEPPPPLDLSLYLALPRPKVLKRLLANLTSLGIKNICLFNAYRVEKPYWSSQQLGESSLREACLLGLEQAGDTVMPTIQIERLFKPFVEDKLSDLSAGTQKFVAHPRSKKLPHLVKGPVSLVIGPEGGFISYEIELLKQAGFEAVDLGSRILTVETAATCVIGAMKF